MYWLQHLRLLFFCSLMRKHACEIAVSTVTVDGCVHCGWLCSLNVARKQPTYIVGLLVGLPVVVANYSGITSGSCELQWDY
jgi:hypothetical protein